MRKLFNHELVESLSISSEDTPDGRYYTIPSGDRLPSVTTVLGRSSDNTWIEEWKKRVGAEKAKIISEKAARRGSIIHGMAEKYVLNDAKYAAGVMPSHTVMFSPIKKVLDHRVNNVYGIELALYSRTLGTAGRTDLVAKFDDVPSIIDYKTSRRIKKEEDIENYFLQSTVYSMMFHRLYNIEIPRIAIIITVEDETNPLVFVKNRCHYIDRVINIFMK
jgi:hypothetical protein